MVIAIITPEPAVVGVVGIPVVMPEGVIIYEVSRGEIGVIAVLLPEEIIRRIKRSAGIPGVEVITVIFCCRIVIITVPTVIVIIVIAVFVIVIGIAVIIIIELVSFGGIAAGIIIAVGVIPLPAAIVIGIIIIPAVGGGDTGTGQKGQANRA